MITRIGLGLAVAAGLGFAASVQGAELQEKLVATKVIDLTHEMHEDMAFWPGGVPFKMTKLLDYEDYGFRLHKFEVGENTGTHVDAPHHFIRDQRSLEKLRVSELVVPAVVIDIQDKVAGNVDYVLTAADVKAWEAEHGEVPEGSFVILNTGWHERFSSQQRYANQDEDGTLHFPGYGPGAARLLLKRGVAGIGIDTLSLDAGVAADFPVHNIMLGAGKYQVENLANLDRLPPTGATVVVGVLPVRNGTQAQARVLAFLP